MKVGDAGNPISKQTERAIFSDISMMLFLHIKPTRRQPRLCMANSRGLHDLMVGAPF